MWQQLGSGKLNTFVISEEIGKTFSHCCVEFCHLKNESMIYFRKTISTRSNFWHLYGSIPMSGLTDFYNGWAFNYYVDRILPFFDPPSLLRGQFLYPECGQKKTFFDPYPPHLVHVVIEWPHWGVWFAFLLDISIFRFSFIWIRILFR